MAQRKSTLYKPRGPAPAPAVPDTVAEAIVEFVADNSWISRGIGWFGGEFWGHMTQHVATELVIDAREDWTTVAELAPGIIPDSRWKQTSDGVWHIPPGVQLRPASYLLENQYSIKVAIPCSGGQHVEFLRALHGELGEPYDKAGIRDFLSRRIIDPAWRGKRHPYFCNALGIWALREGAIIRRLTTPPYRRTPGAALDVCLATEGSRIVSWRGQIVADMIKMAGFEHVAA